MRYKSNLNPSFSKKPISYTCLSNQNKNPILYECNMVGYESAGKDYYLKREGYYNYLINFTLSGKGKLIYKGLEYEVEKGDLLFINCSEEHIFYPSEGNWEFVYIHMNGLGMEYLYNSFYNLTGNVYKKYPSKKIIRYIMENIKQLSTCETKQVGHTNLISTISEEKCLDISSILYNLIIDINKNLIMLDVEIPYSVSKAIKYIEMNYNKNISLKEIANEACLSPFHFERLFHEHMKTTVYQYIKDLRFKKAKWLLETTQKKLIDIALEVGYSDIQALNKMFKSQLGITPTEYRKEKRDI